MNSTLIPQRLIVAMIDDDTELTSMITEWLVKESIDAHCFPSIAQGGEYLRHDLPDVLVLDLMLPDGNGLELCRRLRAEGCSVPILMFTAKGDPMDKVLGLEIGADDYLAKPFEPRELTARIRALARRQRLASPGVVLEFVGMTLDLITRRALIGHTPLGLTSAEFKLLVALAESAGTVIPREQLSAAIQPGLYMPQMRTVDVQIARLRKKLAAGPDGREWIETVRGEGYVFTGRRR